MFDYDVHCDALKVPDWYLEVAAAISNEKIDEAKSLAEAALSKKREALSCYAVAYARLASGDTVAAKKLADEACTFFASKDAASLQGGHEPLYAASLHLTAKALLKDGLLRDAETKANAANEAYGPLHASANGAVTLILAQCKKDAGEAEDTLDKARNYFEDSGFYCRQGIASVLYVKVLHRLRDGALEQALVLADEICKVFEGALPPNKKELPATSRETAAAAARLLVAQVHLAGKNYQEAVLSAKAAADSYGQLGNSRKKSGAINVIANVLRVAGKYSDAHKAANASLDLCREVGDKAGQAAALCMAATISDAQQDYAKAAYKLDRAAKIYKQFGDLKEEALTLESAASTQMKVIQMLDDIAEPEKLCRKALSLYKEIGMELSAEYGYCLQTLSFAMLLQGKSDEAVKEAEASVNAFRELGIASGEAAAYSKLAQIYWSRKHKDDAAKMASKAGKIATDCGDLGEALWANELLQLYTGGKGDKDATRDITQFTDASGATLRTMGVYMYVYGKDYCLFDGAVWRGTPAAQPTKRGKSSSMAVAEAIEDGGADISMDIDWQSLGAI